MGEIDKMLAEVKCENCGSGFAAHIRLDSASSRIIWWNHGKIERNLCGGCAEFSYISMQRRTLIQGWWGPLSALATVFFGLRNVKNISEHRKLVSIMDTEKGPINRIQLLVRNDNAAMIVSSIAILIWVSIGYAIYSTDTAPIDSSPASYMGTCWEDAGNSQLRETNCSSSTAQDVVYKLTSSANDCAGTYISAGIQYACLIENN